MKVMHTVAEFRGWRRGLGGGVGGGGGGGGVVAFVPTMGALHAGHGSLVRAARGMVGAWGDAGGHVVASIFVNPTQFGAGEDFGKYPRTLEADCVLLEAAGCDGVFVPSAEEMYGAEARSKKQEGGGVTVDPGELGTVLEGAIRPGHFRGVCTVVAKLLGIVAPKHLLLGQKDFQQQAILRRMCGELNMAVEVVTCPTVREADGLAMSSRNRYLSAEERERAVGLYEALMWAKGAFAGGERGAAALEAGMAARVAARGLEVHYAVAAEARTLVPWRELGGRVEAGGVMLVAAKAGGTRLIDNVVV